MTAPARFSVIIPVYNKWELTAGCLRSLKEHTPEYPFEVIVADNASSDDTATELAPLGEQLFGERFTLLRFEENRNFGPACNAAAREASAPLLFFLNNDTLLTAGWAPPLLEALESDPGLGGVGPLLLYPDDRVQHLGVFFSFNNVDHLYKFFPRNHPIVKKRRKFQVITAAAIMLPKDIFMEHDGFYESYRNGFEDVDLGLRIHITGKYFTTIPESVVYHLESQSPGRNTNNKANSTLLHKRVSDLIRMDFHLFGLDDGLSIFVNDALDISVIQNMEEQLELLRQTDGKEIGEWGKLIWSNPLWTLGQEHVAAYLEEKGQYATALDLRISLAGILGQEQAYKNLIRCAIGAKDVATRKKGERRLRQLLTLKNDQAGAEAIVQFIQNHAKAHGDELLKKLYREKLQTMFPQS